MDRRSYLLNIVNLDKYKENLFNYVFYNIIPDTVDGKTVKDSGKTKLVEIQGNGVIENQLIFNGNFESTSNWGSTGGTISASDNILTFTVDTAPTSIASNRINQNIDIIAGHKYLVTIEVKAPYNTDIRTFMINNFDVLGNAKANSWTKLSKIYTGLNSTSAGNIYFDCYNQSSYQIGDTIQVRNYEVIDLTLMFGVGNEPTVLTDTRIQSILNREYIVRSEGKYKNSRVGEIDFEPYNLFDEEWRQGDINQTTGELYNTGNNIRSTNLNSVIGGQTYTFEWDRTSCNTAVGGYTYLYIYEYDKNGNYIYFNDTNHAGITVDNKQLTLTSETAYVRVKIYSSGSPAYSSLTKDIIKLCVHRTGTRTGYAPYINSIKLNHFKPNKAGSVEDTYNDFVFTRKVGFVDLGTLSWSYQSANTRWYSNSLSSLSKAPTNNNDVANITAENYETQSFTDADTNKSGIALSTSNTLFIYTDDGVNTPSGMLYYELATPTTITMARNHLQVVDLGSLNWTYQSGSTRFYTYDLSTLIVKPAQNSLPNGWCSKYLLCSWNDKAFGYISVNNDGMIIVMDSNYTDSATFTTAMSGVYLFYETASPLNEFASGVLTDTTKISLPATFELNGAIAAHDTFTINSQGYVFTRNIWNVHLGSLDWQYAGANIFYASLSDVKSTSDSSLANILCPNYTTVKRNDLNDKTICVSATDIITKDTSYSNAATYKTAMSGIYAQYELATPQVITIPKGHLGCVDLGTLDWRYADNLQVFRVDNFPMKSRGELFVLKYITDLEKYPSNILDKQISNRPYYTNNNLFIKDTAYSDATVFKQAMAGVYLFYETDTETNDFVSKAIFERGGTINTNEFSWVENQLVGHGNFDYTGSAQSNNWYSIQTYYSLSVANDKATITKTASGTSAMLYKANADMPITLNHKYFIRCCVKCSTASSVRVNSGVYGTTINLNANQITWLEDIYDVTSMNQLYLALVEMTDAAVGTTYEVYYFMSFDLTLGFGAGNEPTDIRDPRIQRIIQLGYIPTNTNGTLTNVQNEVLANVKMKLQVK